MHRTDLPAMFLGLITTTTIGTLIFQALGTLVLGIIGALGGYLFNRFLRPKLDKLFTKKNKEA